NYVVNVGSGKATMSPPEFSYDAQFPTDGIFWYGSKTNFNFITDGTSNTLLVSECLRGPGQPAPAGASVTPPPGIPGRYYVALNTSVFLANSSLPGGWIYNGNLVTYRPSECDNGARKWGVMRGSTWFWGGRDWNSVFNAALTPNSPIWDCGAHGRGW